MQFRFSVAGDDDPLYVIRRDISAGVNTRQGENVIQENQSTVLENVILDVAGERSLRSGSTLVEDIGTTTGTGCFAFQPDGGTNELLVTHSTKLEGYTGSGTFTEHKDDFTTGLQTTMVQALESDEADVVIVQNGTDNAFRMKQDHTFQDLGDTNTSPPKTLAMTYYRDRLWTLENNKLSYSGAVPADYSNTFNRASNYYNIPVGTEKAIAGTRDFGLIIFGSEAVYQLNPSLVPDPAADKAELVLSTGCANGNTVKQVGDDFFYLAHDGIRALRRTAQDKLQAGQAVPLSYLMLDETDSINWAAIAKADAVYFENKYIVTLPVEGSTYNNRIWVYYPALNAWTVITGLNIARFAVVKFSGQEKLYGIDSTDAKVYLMFDGTSDNGVAITYTEEGRAEDFGQPLVFKSGGEFKITASGGAATIVPYASVDGSGYQALNGSSLVMSGGGLDFDFDFPFNFFSGNEYRGVWHLDPLGKFKLIKFKIYSSGSTTAQFKIKESLAVTYKDEYLLED